jgi:hypothetical protein
MSIKSFWKFFNVKIVLQKIKNPLQEEGMFSPYLCRAYALLELAPCINRLPGFIGPVPPPLWISNINFLKISS